MSSDDDEDRWERTAIASPLGGAGEGGDRAYLIVLAGSRVGEVVRISERLVVGRGDQADFRVLDTEASRAHLEIVESGDGGIIATDLASSNGTYVNGQRIDSVTLRDGDKIRVGSTTILKFSYGDDLDEVFARQMYEAAVRDPLTQLYNRRHIQEQLASEFRHALRQGTPLSVLLMDLDHFKRVNDTHGHLVGDQVLQGFAELLRRATRATDLAARWGGEEFMLICRSTALSAAEAVAERVRSQAEQATLVSQLKDLRVTVSCGVASAPTATITEPLHLVGAADRALYQAKEGGRNRVCVG